MDIIILNIACYLMFPLIILWKSEYLRNGWNENVLTKDVSAAMRGIAAIFIVLAHYLYYVREHGMNRLGPARLMEWCGGLGVCVFFFASGYGLFMAYRQKNVDRYYLYNRFKNIIPTTIILRLIFGLISGVPKKGAVYFLLYIINLREPLWFVSEIILIYIIFYIAMKISKKHSITLISAMLIVMSLIFCLLDFEARWYNANLVFTAGLLAAKYRGELLDFFKKRFFLKLGALLVLFGVSAVGFSILKGGILPNLLKLLAGTAFSLGLFCVLMKLRLHSQLLISIGRASLQVYIIHLGVRDIFSAALGESFLLLQFIGGIVISVVAALGWDLYFQETNLSKFSFI